MRFSTPLILTMSMLALTGGVAACQLPPNFQPGYVSVEWQDAGYVVDQTRGIQELDAMARAGGIHVSPSQGGMRVAVRGLTVAREQGTFAPAWVTWRDPDGGVCVMPGPSRLAIGYPSPQVIYLQAGYLEGSCQHTVLLDHEFGHVRINREVLAQHLPNLQTTLNQAFAPANGWPIRVQSESQVSGVMLRLMQQVLETELAAFRIRRDAMHAVLDSPASYMATSRACPQW